MTIQQAREKLSGIIPLIFPNTFTQKVEMIKAQVSEQNAPSIIAQNLKASDSYILLASKHLSSVTDLSHIAAIVNPLVAFATYMRYYFTVNILATKPKQKQIAFPEDDAAFLTDILIDYWPTIMAELSRH